MIPITVESLYKDAADAVSTQANGDLSYTMFNRLSRLAELSIIDWITGSLTGNTPPEPYTTQKVKDWVAPFIAKHTAHVGPDGILTRPKDYYGFENLVVIGVPRETDCEDDEDVTPEDTGDTPVTLLDGGQFTTRTRTYIDEIKPSLKEPIAKAVGKTFEFAPKNVGPVRLEYYRYPVFANAVTTTDNEFNEEVIDESASTNYEWDEKARGLLIWFIVDRFANRTSNQSMKVFNKESKDPLRQP